MGGVLFCMLFSIFLSNAQEAAIYAGGPIYYTPGSIQELKNSGFSTVIVWTIHIEANGDLGFNGEFPLVRNGEYIGNETYPEFPANINALKTAPTSINRVEFGLSAAGSGTFDAVRDFYNSEGFGPGTTLYNNFKALQEAIPYIDAFNNDDERTYHVESAVAFTKMLAELGFKNAIVPYTRTSFWRALVQQVNSEYPNNIDRNYLQCYAGGGGNNPCSSSWDFGIPVYPGLWGGPGRTSISGVRNRMNNWQDQCGITGGFMWIYDEFDGTPDVAGYASAINDALAPIGVPGIANNPNPTNNASNISISSSLSWSAGTSATSHSIYLSTDSTINADDLQTTQSNTSFSPTNLQPSTTYFWRIDEINSVGTTQGNVWSFTTSDNTTIDHTDPVGTGTITARASINNAENQDKAFDNLFASGSQNNDWSKWLDNGGVPSVDNPSWIQIQLPNAVTVNQLAIVSANDVPDRDPENFNIQGSNNGNSWTTLSNWSNQQWNSRLQRKDFNINNTDSYSYYRINFSKNRGNIDMTQLAEILLIGPKTDTTPPNDCNDCINFNQINLTPYSNQDADNQWSITENGLEISLTGNTWKRTENTYQVTANTMLEFEYQSTDESEIQGIGFDEDNSFSSDRIFKIYGTQSWGIQDYDNYNNNGNYRTYSIPVGQFYTGNQMNLILVNDNDRGNGNSSFKNIRIYETTSVAKSTLQEMTFTNIYPSPFKHRFSISFPNENLFQNAVLLDVQGKMVWKSHITKTQTSIQTDDLGHLKNGLYILQLMGKNKVKTHKIIKQ